MRRRPGRRPGERPGGVLTPATVSAISMAACVALVLAAVALAAIVLSGCTKIGTAGVSTTIGCYVMTTDPRATTVSTAPTRPATPGATPGAASPSTAAPDAAAQRQRLEQANELATAQLTGITLFGAPWVDQCINESQLIVRGTVLGVDDPRTGNGSFSNPYTVFYVEPQEVLKGASRLGSPVPFVLLLPGDGSESRPWVAPGDEVLVFSQFADTELVTSSEAAGAYLLWNDSYGAFMPVGDRFANVLAPEVTTTLDEVRRSVGPGDTSTTLGPGQMTFGSVNVMFEMLLEWKDLPGTLPYRALGADELAWLAEAQPEIKVREAKGYELANGEVAILFYYEPTLRTDEDVEAAEERLTALVKRQYPDSSDIAHATLPYIDNYGYVLISDDPDGELSSLLHRARTGPVPPDR
jgi:hypothetical protein